MAETKVLLNQDLYKVDEQLKLWLTKNFDNV